MTPVLLSPEPLIAAGRVVLRLFRKLLDWWRGETARTYFDPHSPRELAGLLAPFDLPAPTADATQAGDGPAGAARFVLGLWATSPAVRRQFPDGLTAGEDGPFARWLAAGGPARFGLTTAGVANVRAAFAERPFDRVARVYEGRADVRAAHPLGLTPAGRGDYAHWLLLNGRAEVGFTADDVLWFLFALAVDPACGLAATFRVTTDWQRAVPHGLTVFGWEALRKHVAETFPDRCGRWLRGASLTDAFGPWDQVLLLQHAHPKLVPEAAVRAAEASDPGPLVAFLSGQRTVPRPPAAWLARLAADVRSGLAAEPGVNLLGYFRYDSGLQEEIVQKAAAFRRAGYRTALRDFPVCYPRDWRDADDYTAPELFPVSIHTVGAGEWVDRHYQRTGLHPRPGAYRVVNWLWELEAFPREAIDHAGVIDEVWTPSTFCTEAVRKVVGDRPVHTLLPAVALPAFAPLPRSHFGLPDDRLLFLFMFDMGSVMERKNPLGLIAAFREAFGTGDRTHLAIKVSRATARPADRDRLMAAADAAGVTVIDRVMPRAEALALMATCDAYVSLHRSEGFGFTLAEAMLMGKPTVGTNYSAPLDFMTPANSLLVDYRRATLDREHGPYPAGAAWAEPSVGHAAERMRWVAANREEAAALGAKGRDEVAALLSQEAAGRRMLARVEEIRAGLRGRPAVTPATS